MNKVKKKIYIKIIILLLDNGNTSNGNSNECLIDGERDNTNNYTYLLLQ